jgi:hypothetical protein
VDAIRKLDNTSASQTYSVNGTPTNKAAKCPKS